MMSDMRIGNLSQLWGQSVGQRRRTIGVLMLFFLEALFEASRRWAARGANPFLLNSFCGTECCGNLGKAECVPYAELDSLPTFATGEVPAEVISPY